MTAIPPTEQTNPLLLPFARTPVAFRWWFGGCVLTLGCCFAALFAWAPGPDLVEISREPGALILLGLIVLADLYPTLPWMRNSNPFGDFILSTPLLIAALLAYGPHAAAAFLIAGAVMTIAARMVWWRVLLNVALLGLQGVAAAGVLALITGPFTWDTPMTSAEMLPATVVLAIVVEGLNVLLVGTSVNLVGASTWRENVADWRRQIAIGTLALTAPIPAVLALYQPLLLPLLALAMVAAQSGMSAVSSRTALAGTDPLTAVANRAAFMTALRARLGQNRRPEESVTLLLVDLDGFKLVNDRYGHLTGDRVLVEVANRLEESTRSEDLVARLGGDEFAVLLASGVSNRTVGEVADRIKGAVAKPMEVAEQTLLVGVSIGWALTSAQDRDANSLLERADARLYRAKAERTAKPSGEADGLLMGDGSKNDGTAELAGSHPKPSIRLVDNPKPADSRPDWAEPIWSLAQSERSAAHQERW